MDAVYDEKMPWVSGQERFCSPYLAGAGHIMGDTGSYPAYLHYTPSFSKSYHLTYCLAPVL